MIRFFPQKIANKGIIIYLISLAAVSILFFKHAMGITYILLGLMWVIGFFTLSSTATKRWASLSPKRFCSTVFWVAFAIRVAWVIFSYFFYISKTGQPFEFGAADAVGYHEEAKWLSQHGWETAFNYWGSRGGYSDVGYPFWLTVVYSIFGPSIIVERIIKCILSSFTCILIFKLARRNIGEFPARMAAIFCTFIPNLIMYCGMHLKEIEMIFLTVAFIERADFLFREKHYTFWNILIPFFLGISLFFFRTVLGIAALFALITALVFLPKREMKSRAKRSLLITWCAIGFIALAGGTIANEVEGVWERRDQDQERKRSEQTSRGNQWAKYATATVLAPIEFIMPLATMVDTDEQYNQQMLSGGNYVRNFFGVFVLLALMISIFRKKEWRSLSLIGAFTVMYLLIVGKSGFANSERFLLPTLPFLLILTAYGISNIEKKDMRYVSLWMYIVPVLEIGWAYFKLGSRGIL